MKVRRLFFREMGTYSDLYTCPYTTEGDGNVVRDLDELTMGGRQISPGLISGISSRILRPTANIDRERDRIFIPNGWNTRRFMFIMEVEIARSASSVSVEIITGYTDHNEVITRSQNISEDTVLRFNGMYTVRTMQVYGARGVQESTSIVDPIQLVPRRRKPTFGFDNGGRSGDTVRMCPEDLFTIKTQVPEFEELANVDGYHDTRGTIMRALSPCRRENNLSSHYLTRALVAARDSQDDGFLGDDDGENSRFVRARGLVREPLLSNRQTMAKLADETSILDSGYITYGELLSMDPNVDNIVQINFNDDRASYIDHRNESESWHDRTTERMCATIIAHAIPNLLMESMYSHAQIVSTNLTYSGRFQSTALKLHPYMQGVDLDENYNMLFSKIDNELMPGLLLNDQMVIDVTIECAIYADTIIDISVDGGPREHFVFPSFCDSLAALTVSDSRDDLHLLANDIIGIGDQLGFLDESDRGRGRSETRIVEETGYKSVRSTRRFNNSSY